MELLGVFDAMTVVGQCDVEKGAEKGRRRRSGAEKYGINRWTLVQVQRLRVEVHENNLMLRQLLLGLASLMQYEGRFLEDVAVTDRYGRRDDLDFAILSVLRQAPASGILPRDIYLKVRRSGLLYHHVSRRVKRMNKRLREKTGQDAAVKVGNRWSLSSFMRQNWGARLEEVENVEEVEHGEEE
jgi:hypothetical protein